jgi:hypothetical protein
MRRIARGARERGTGGGDAKHATRGGRRTSLWLDAFGNSRYWQVIDPAGKLVCVAVYERGGREVMRRLAA